MKKRLFSYKSQILGRLLVLSSRPQGDSRKKPRSSPSHYDCPPGTCIPSGIRVCGLGTIWIWLARFQRVEPLKVGPSGLTPTYKEVRNGVCGKGEGGHGDLVGMECL